ncbi:transporter substrate-binding domain-containing protein [Pseudomonas sp. N040]|uniref:transporter substrate-binding domain-containing protein n=1 Tax=Pseudomonas sp. N040 TaxID=2785325 RepID=UPI0018A2AFB5|nr:transporter substrate-binding domain-containing protein [Pseudomonas sp. N040]MBF7731389.1 transporter substrate-binding domain-containing protein [Pseudomonas sp. N040]MBW7015032.1 transporter substrate-binding domain-containing protein [Pseudomonas sp. N040]
MREAYEQIGVSINIEEMPGARAIYLAGKGEVDGYVCASDTTGILDSSVMIVPERISTWDVYAFADKRIKAIDLGKISDGTYRVSHQRGSIGIEKNKKMNLHPANNTASGLLQLTHDRTDVFLGDREIVLAEATGLGIADSLLVSDKPVLSFELYHVLAVKYRPVVESLNPILKKMKATGRIDKIKLEVENDFKARALNPATAFMP